MTSENLSYRGRFAPSPTGRLHFGSLVAALASYLEAHHHNGRWLVRMEDLDPPREQPGAAKDILNTLEAFSLYWDESVVYQSHRLPLYQEKLEQLKTLDAVYACECSRKQIREFGGVYPGTCRSRQLPFTKHNAVRIKQSREFSYFDDKVQGEVSIPNDMAHEDFIVRRRDQLFAYQLAVVVDDIEQKITDVVRGADLLDSTPKQLKLYQLFKSTPPSFCHIPLATFKDGSKLSKQNLAPAIKQQQAQSLLVQALVFLGQRPEQQLIHANCEDILKWATMNWNLSWVPKKNQLPLPDQE